MGVKPSVLFVCVHNAGRSQIAAGFLESFGAGKIDVLSAGSAPKETLNPVAVAAMAEVGIDIEKQRLKIGVIAHKFMDYEYQYLDDSDKLYIQKLTVIWCIKESLYKLFATPGLSFLQNTLVIPFTVDEGTTVAWIDYDDKKYRYDTTYFEFEGFTCAYALPS